MLEAEAHQNSILLPESIKRAKGEGVKTENRVIILIEAFPEDLSVNKEGDTMEWIFKLHLRYQQ